MGDSILPRLSSVKRERSRSLARNAAQTARRTPPLLQFLWQRLGLDDRRAFLAFIRQQAHASAWPEERAFLEQLPTLLGWEDGQ